jgi:cytochrome P450
MTTAPTTPPLTTTTSEVPRASLADTAATVSEVLVPLTSRGAIVRRPPVKRVLDRFDLDRRAIARLQQLEDRYGPGPVLLRLPKRELAVVLDPDDVHRILAGTPEPFATANLEKRAALAHFQPESSLISHGPERAARRRFNEVVLDTAAPIHRIGDRVLTVVRQETDELLTIVERTGELTWDDHVAAWYRIVRRVVLGDGARDDHVLTDLLAQLREYANWSYLRPTDRTLRRRFHRRLIAHLDAAEPGSLAAVIADEPSFAHTKPHQQVPQWLFAFEPAGMAAIRALALLATHPEAERQLRAEVSGLDLTTPHRLPYLRACVLESLRLWPTTPAVLRDTTEDTTWRGARLPAGSGLLVFAPYFHRDPRRLASADRFAPQLWDDADGAATGQPLIPFSEGPGVCPGQNLVLLVTSTFLAALGRRQTFELTSHRFGPHDPLPSVLDPYELRFRPTGRASTATDA